jgi:hypothetical protein
MPSRSFKRADADVELLIAAVLLAAVLLQPTIRFLKLLSRQM